MSQWITTSIVIVHDLGLHARPSVLLTKSAKGFAANLQIATNPEGPWIDAKSIVKVMALKAKQHATLYIRASGDGAETAVAAIVTLISNDFTDAT
jgi:phosphocarrier protein HPr